MREKLEKGGLKTKEKKNGNRNWRFTWGQIKKWRWLS
jgi:hypothetical protein